MLTLSKSRIKSRSGCEQCKRRKVKCDEKRPTCTRCVLRGDTCTGTFTHDSWQIERPWISHERAAEALNTLENDALRHWYDNACLNMSMFRPPVNPLSHALSGWLRHSKALRHTIESVALAHQEHFLPDKLSAALQARGLAISSLRNEVDQLQSSQAKKQARLRTAILSSLILCVSSPWLDPTGKDIGVTFLAGASSILQSLASSHPQDPFAFYLFGLFLYCDAFSSFLVSSNSSTVPTALLLEIIQEPPLDSYVHPVTGISGTLCPLISEAGRYLRCSLDMGTADVFEFVDIETRLQRWEPPANAPRQAQLLELAEGYRSVGFIMLYQAKAAQGFSDAAQSSLLSDMVLGVMKTLKHIPNEDPLLNWVGPLLVIAGSELPADRVEERELVERTSARLVTWTRVQTYSCGMDLVKEVWRLHEMGIGACWLEVMMSQGKALALW